MSLFCPECHTSFDDESMRVCPSDGTRLFRVNDDDPLIGGVIDGRFRVDYTLGVGGMGTVYGGVQLSVNRDVAIKVLRTELASKEVALERFFREAKTISNLSHPNIVKLVDFGQDRERGLLYLAMELVRGQNLADMIDAGRLRTPMALEVVYQVCGALTEPHAAGVIHRDLKPDNLLMVPVSDGTMQVKVLDFGIARFMESNTQLTGTGMICGTPAYMAPEQAQNETLDSRTDLYALGVILYEMLSGWPPFSGTSSLQVMLKHIQENPLRLRDLLPPATLPESIEDLVYELMAKERTTRPKSARLVRDRIDRIRGDLGFRPVRLPPNDGEEERFEAFILPKLPRPDQDKSGPTQVLRRETGLEEAIEAGKAPDTGDDLGTEEWRSETEADESLGVTGPLTPDGKKSVLNDAKGVKLGTREGGQQAWTPGDQAAVRAIKDTKDAVDVFGATEANAPSVDSVPGATDPSSGKPRRTMVEPDSSAPLLGVGPATEDNLEKPNTSPERAAAQELPAETEPSVEVAVELDPDRTVTGERLSATPASNTKLVIAAILGGVLTVGAAIYVVQKIDEVVSGANTQPAPLAVKGEHATEKANPGAAESDIPDPGAVADLVSAQFKAQSRIHRGIGAAAREAKPTKTSPTVAAGESGIDEGGSETVKNDAPVRARPASDDSPSTKPDEAKTKKSLDDRIESLGLRKEDG